MTKLHVTLLDVLGNNVWREPGSQGVRNREGGKGNREMDTYPLFMPYLADVVPKNNKTSHGS